MRGCSERSIRAPPGNGLTVLVVQVAGLDSPYLAYGGAVILGLLHGSDPGHGWPLSTSLSLAGGTAYRRALAYTTILALGHFISALFVVVIVWILGSRAGPYLDYLKLAAGSLLVAVGAVGLYRELRERPGGLEGRAWDARSLFKYSLLLGFAHEEEVALAAIVLLGANPLLLASAYSASVYASMLLWTYVSLLAVARRRGLSEALSSKAGLLSHAFLVIIGAYILLSA